MSGGGSWMFGSRVGIHKKRGGLVPVIRAQWLGGGGKDEYNIVGFTKHYFRTKEGGRTNTFEHEIYRDLLKTILNRFNRFKSRYGSSAPKAFKVNISLKKWSLWQTISVNDIICQRRCYLLTDALNRGSSVPLFLTTYEVEKYKKR